MSKKQTEKENPKPGEESASKAVETAPAENGEQSTEERIAELEQQLAASDANRKELEAKLSKQAEAHGKATERIKELSDQLAVEAPPAEAEKPKGPPPKPKPGDCRGCIHFPANVSESGRAAEDWGRRTKSFTMRPCGDGPCADKKFEKLA